MSYKDEYFKFRQTALNKLKKLLETKPYDLVSTWKSESETKYLLPQESYIDDYEGNVYYLVIYYDGSFLGHTTEDDTLWFKAEDLTTYNICWLIDYLETGKTHDE